MRLTKTFSGLFCVAALAVFCCGCATTGRKTALEVISLNGRRYVALEALCSTRNLQQQYDGVAHRLTLSQTSAAKAGPAVSMAVGEKVVLVNGQPRTLKYPVEMREKGFLIPADLAPELESLFGKQVCSLARPANTFSAVRTIAIDAGHGGRDPGAISRSGLREKEVTLDIARRLKSILEAKGARVVLVRDSDRFIPLDRRAEIAADSGADIFVSIHVNANKHRSINGFEVYHISEKISDSRRAVLSSQGSRLPVTDGVFGKPSKALQTALWDMVHTFNRGESKSLSRIVCRQAECDLETRSADTKSANFAVLRGASIPAVLVEVGYLSNPREERLLRQDSFRQSVAESIARGVAAYAAERA